MKKLSILGLCLCAAFAASAQQNVVKEAEKAMKANQPMAKVVEIVTPAFSDPTTKNHAQPYYIAGKAGFNEYDALLGKRSLGRADENTPVTMAHDLLSSYDYFMKALPLDSLPDEKGKVKPKYSKDIYSTLGGHFADFSNSAVDLWNAKEYANAYKSWGNYLKLAKDPRFAKFINGIPADTTLADIAYNQALAAWQADSLQQSLAAFRNAIKLGYNKKSVYEYAVAVATNAKDNDALLEFATAGNAKFGNEENQFLNQIINYYLQTEKYDEALAYLDKGISENPNNAQYYSLRGIIYDNQKQSDKAHADYAKALELDPANALGLFYMGRNIAAKAGEMQDAYDKNDFESYKKSTIDPQYREAVGFLEKAYEVDQNNRPEVLKILEILYYNLNDNQGLESVKQRKEEL